MQLTSMTERNGDEINRKRDLIASRSCTQHLVMICLFVHTHCSQQLPWWFYQTHCRLTPCLIGLSCVAWVIITQQTLHLRHSVFAIALTSSAKYSFSFQKNIKCMLMISGITLYMLERFCLLNLHLHVALIMKPCWKSCEMNMNSLDPSDSWYGQSSDMQMCGWSCLWRSETCACRCEKVWVHSLSAL